MEEEKNIVSEFAIASLVMGIVSFVHLFSLEKPVIAIVFGILAMRRMGKNNKLEGRKLAVSGIILGAISFILILGLTIKYFPQLKQMVIERVRAIR